MALKYFCSRTLTPAFACALLGVLMAACAAPQQPPPGPASAGSQPVLVMSDAVKRLPIDTELVIVAASVTQVVETVGWLPLTTALGGTPESAAEGITRMTGHNLLDLAELSAIGIDPDKPWGFAWLDSEHETGVIFASLSDADAFKATLYRSAANFNATLEQTDVGRGVVIYPRHEDEVAFLISGDLAFFVGTDDGEALDVATQLAVRLPEKSLARDAGYERAVTGMSFGKDVAGYASRDFIDMAMEIDGIAGPVAFGFAIEERAVKARALVAVPEGSFLRGLLRSGSEGLAIVDATTQKPVFLVGGHIDTAAAMRVPELADAANEVSEFLKIDLQGELLPLISGEVGVSVTLKDVNLADDDADVLGAIGVHVAVGLTDADAARKLVARVMAQPPLATLATAGADPGSFTLPFPGWKTLHVGVTGSHLTVSTDPEFAGRVGHATGGASLATALGNDSLARLLGHDESAGVGMLSALTGMLLWSGSDYSVSYPVASPPAEPGDVPYSEEYLAKKRELEAFVKNMREERRAREAAQRRTMSALWQKLGVTAFRAETTEDAIVLTGGQYLGAPVAKTFREIASLVTQLDNRYDGDTLKSFSHRERLRMQLEEIRRRDIEAANADAAKEPVKSRE